MKYKCPICNKEIDKLLYTRVLLFQGAIYLNIYGGEEETAEKILKYHCPNCNTIIKDKNELKVEEISK